MVQFGLPQIYRRSADNLNFNVDYFDYAAGAGYKRYYLGGSEVSGANVYFLTTDTIDGSVDVRSLPAASATASQAFILTFNNPATIASADAICEYTSSTNNAMTYHSNIQVFHVDSAGTGTSLGKAFLAARTSGAGSTYIREALVVALSQKAFGVGDKLKIVVELVSSGNTANIYFDPGSRQTFTEGGSGATIGSDFTITLPFKIDL